MWDNMIGINHPKPLWSPRQKSWKLNTSSPSSVASKLLTDGQHRSNHLNCTKNNPPNINLINTHPSNWLYPPPPFSSCHPTSREPPWSPLEAPCQRNLMPHMWAVHEDVPFKDWKPQSGCRSERKFQRFRYDMCVSKCVYIYITPKTKQTGRQGLYWLLYESNTCQLVGKRNDALSLLYIGWKMLNAYSHAGNDN